MYVYIHIHLCVRNAIAELEEKKKYTKRLVDGNIPALKVHEM